MHVEGASAMLDAHYAVVARALLEAKQEVLVRDTQNQCIRFSCYQPLPCLFMRPAEHTQPFHSGPMCGSGCGLSVPFHACLRWLRQTEGVGRAHDGDVPMPRHACCARLT